MVKYETDPSAGIPVPIAHSSEVLDSYSEEYSKNLVASSVVFSRLSLPVHPKLTTIHHQMGDKKQSLGMLPNNATVISNAVLKHWIVTETSAVRTSGVTYFVNR
jgi:hypothetical protein